MRYYRVTDSVGDNDITYFLFSNNQDADSESMSKTYDVGDSAKVEEVSARDYSRWVGGLGCLHVRDSDVDEDPDDFSDENYND